MILPSLAKTGPGFVVKDLCTEFVGMGHECKIFYFDEGEGLEMPCPTECIKFHAPFDFENWDVIHSHMFRPDAYVWYHRKKIRKSGAKTVSTLHNPISYTALHDTYSKLYSAMGTVLWPLFLKWHNTIIVLNNVNLTNLPTHLQSKSHIIFNGRNIIKNDRPFKLPEYSQIMQLKRKHLIIGSIGSLTRRKGIDQLIRVLPLLPNYALLLIGDGEQLLYLKNMAEKLNVDSRCVFLGFKSNPTDYLSLVDVFAMCSKSEGFPLAFIEAGAYGLSTVLSDIDIFKSIVPDNTVEFYQLENIEDLRNAILTATSNNVTLRKNIFLYYTNNLTATIMAKNYIKAYIQQA